MGVCTCNTLFTKKTEVTVVHDKPKSTNQFASQLNTNRQDNTSQHYYSDFKTCNVSPTMRTLNKSLKPQQKTTLLAEQPHNNNSNTTNNSNTSNTMINQTIICVNPLSIKNQTTVNIIILGATKVGKSAFLIKITENTFEKLYIPTIYVENQRKAVSYNSKQYTLNFTVTATGVYKEDYTCVYNGMHFFLVFYDITNMSSFTEAIKLYNKELKNKHMHYNYEVSNVFFVGNKVDEQPREVNIELCEEYCDKSKIKLFEISVKTHKNITQMLNFITHTFDLVAFST